VWPSAKVHTRVMPSSSTLVIPGIQLGPPGARAADLRAASLAGLIDELALAI
jgi:hypothetical protein